jgi:hypothetical protein
VRRELLASAGRFASRSEEVCKSLRDRDGIPDTLLRLWHLLYNKTLIYWGPEDRLTTLNQLPLVYDRELRDLVLVYKSIFGCIDLNIEQFVSFVQHSRSRSHNPSLVLKPSYCKTSTFQASFFNRVVKPWSWNFVCEIFASLVIFKRFLHTTYSNLVKDTFSVDMPLVTHTRLLLPSFLNCIMYCIYIYCKYYLVILLFRGCALHGFRFPVCTIPIGRSTLIYSCFCPINKTK